MNEILAALPERLLPWFREHRRELPWRQDREPYHIWLSEIMLQQTRVEAVKGYYARFLKELPTVEALSRAPEDQLRKLWEGLGYYTRVSNLKKAAARIMEQHGGVFPADFDAIRALPGIGDYTAGAIASIAFGQRKAAVDGNVLRVRARLLADPAPIDDPKVKKLAAAQLEAIYPSQAGDFTQALMELGATVCLPNGTPACEKCPMADLCRSRAQGIQQTLPKKSPKKPRRQEEKTVLLLRCNGRIAIERRAEKGLLAGLWQFPNMPGHLSEQEAALLAERWGCHPRQLLRSARRTHIFTHIEWDMHCYLLECAACPEGFTWLTPGCIEAEAALPTAFRQFWDLITETEDTP